MCICKYIVHIWRERDRWTKTEKDQDTNIQTYIF